MGAVGQRIKELRKASNLTQQELAEGVVTRSYISQIEKGLIQPSYDTLDKLSKKLDCTVEDFFKEPENKALLVSEWKKFIRFAEQHVESGHFDQAQKTLDNANIDSPDELNEYDHGLLAWVNGRLAEQRGDRAAAAELFEKSILHLENNNYVRERIRSMDSLAYVYLLMNHNDKALVTLNEAYQTLIHYQIGGLTKVSLLINFAMAHGKLGENHSAIRFWQEANDLNHTMRAFYRQGHIVMGLGNCYFQIGDLGQAEHYYHRALAIHEATENLNNKAGVYTNLGKLYVTLQDYPKAIEALLTSIHLYEGLNKEEKLVNAKAEIAEAFFAHEDYDQAAKYCYQILSAKHEYKHKGTANKILGSVEVTRGNLEKALENFTESLDLFAKHDYPLLANEVLRRMADVYFDQGEFQKAAEYYRQVKAAQPKAL
ncbi:helix-turn-helix domain-containing protein [Tumebacillus permanentifrigoris]|uniref:DNA-binding XRE family transcriptional regulator n=1 Tax=Tumebacillus permanentifrigoris TaxID=378543 RepID=A0A316DC43_9BACL|nr:helix-turn-helix domain-containing protein [Tumebacillus permanentifrigoris]PWK14919.1 DNA-binding XRE family transcriptional regulator [Tumebacillus permanentifrigoris]